MKGDIEKHYFTDPFGMRRISRAPAKAFAFFWGVTHSLAMKQPLALLVYETLYPGGHLVTRLEDRGYRVQSLADPAHLVDQAKDEKPLIIIADLEPRHQAVCEGLIRLKNHPATTHIPVIAVVDGEHEDAHRAARAAGASLVVSGKAILAHLDQFLQQALEV